MLLSAMMVFSLAACGGGDAEGGNDQQVENNADANDDADVNNDADASDEVDANDGTDVSGDYTTEQAECINAYNQMLADYQAAIDTANATPELNEDTDLAAMINEVTDSINTLTDMMADPANMTDDFISTTYTVIDNAYIIANRINTYAELLPILTVAGAGADEEENTYWFACNEDETVGAMIILSADETQYVYCVGEMVVDENGIYTINDEDGYTMSMAVEAVEGGLILTMQDGTEVGMVAATPREVIEVMLTIEETTENVNE